jgi:formate dehydrogenase major subunit
MAGKQRERRVAMSTLTKTMPSGAAARRRLTTPLVRRDGELQPATWDEALDRAAGGFRALVDEHGPGAFGLFSCSKSTNEMNYAAQKLARTALGSNNIDSCNRT